MFFESRCAACGADAPLVCRRCEVRLRPLTPAPGSMLRSRFELEPTVREIIASWKYRRERRVAGWAAEQLEPFVPLAADVVTWCPATPGRVRRRGFDQGRELAVAVSRRTGIPARRLLRRSLADGRQTGRSRAERARGPLLDAVARVDGMVVVVDDVTTTGASLDAARRVLETAGAERVVALTVAATPRLVP